MPACHDEDTQARAAPGFRQLDVNNWLEVNPLMQTTVISAPGGDPREAWFETLSEFQLDDAVPGDIARLFEAARSMLLYGLFFYPLIALGADQLVRVVETAVRMRCLALGADHRQIRSFFNATGWLTRRECIGRAPTGPIFRLPKQSGGRVASTAIKPAHVYLNQNAST